MYHLQNTIITGDLSQPASWFTNIFLRLGPKSICQTFHIFSLQNWTKLGMSWSLGPSNFLTVKWESGQDVGIDSALDQSDLDSTCKSVTLFYQWPHMYSYVCCCFFLRNHSFWNILWVLMVLRHHNDPLQGSTWGFPGMCSPQKSKCLSLFSRFQECNILVRFQFSDTSQQESLTSMLFVTSQSTKWFGGIWRCQTNRFSWTIPEFQKLKMPDQNTAYFQHVSRLVNLQQKVSAF